MKNFFIKKISLFCKIYFSLRYGKKISWGKNIILNWRFCFSGSGKLIIHDNVNLWAHEEPSRFQTYSPDAIISIGKNSRINGALFQCRKKISIGKNCLIGSAIILDTDFHHSDPIKRRDTQNIPTKEISIAENVWIGGQSVIIKGVEIGKNSVVAIRAVVSKNVLENTVVAGNPAQEVKRI